MYKRKNNNNNYKKNNYKKRKKCKECIPYKNVEKKYIDSYYQFVEMGSNDGTSSAIILDNINNNIGICSEVAKGTNSNEAIGLKFNLKSISIKGRVSMNGHKTTANTGTVEFYSQYYRLLVVLDTQFNERAVGTDDIFQDWDNTSPRLGQINCYTFKNLTRGKRFRILKEFKGILKPNGYSYSTDTTGVDTIMVLGDSNVIDWHYNCDIPIVFKDVGGTDTNFTQNMIMLVGLASNTTIVVDPNINYNIPTFSGIVRSRFTDM